MNALNASLAGIQRAEQRLDTTASRLASGSVPGSDVDTAKEMVGLDTAKTDLQASVAVAKTASATMGTLVDMFA
jgi:hypothetical protein